MYLKQKIKSQEKKNRLNILHKVLIVDTRSVSNHFRFVYNFLFYIKCYEAGAMKVLNVQKTKEIINSKYKYQNWMAFIRLCYRSFLQQSLNEEKCHLETDQSSFLAISK